MTKADFEVTTNVIRLPVPQLFEAEVIDGAKVLATYDEHRVYVATCVRMLKMSPQEMQRTVAAAGLKSSEENFIEGLIQDIENCAEDFAALAHFFECLSSRLTAIRHRLI